MFGIGGWELLVVAVVALVVLGPKGLPSAARAIGRVAAELRRATTDLRQSIELDPDLKEIPSALDELNRPLLGPNPTHRRRSDSTPKDGPPDDLPPRPPRRDIEIDPDLEEPENDGPGIRDVDAGATAADGLPPYAAAAATKADKGTSSATPDGTPSDGEAAAGDEPAAAGSEPRPGPEGREGAGS